VGGVLVTAAVESAERLQRTGDHVVEGRVDVDADRANGALECGELRVEQGGGHVVADALGQPRGDHIALAVEEHEGEALVALAEALPVGSAQRRAGQHQAVARVDRRVEEGSQTLQPRPAVLVGEGRAGRHLGAVLGAVVVVAVLEAPAERVGERATDARLADAGDAHHDDGRESLHDALGAAWSGAR
jgi:hypothetical protein